MGSIGAPELIVVALIGLLVCAGPLALAIFFLARKKPTAGAPAGLIQCPACGQAISPRAHSCPHCGEPRAVR